MRSPLLVLSCLLSTGCLSVDKATSIPLPKERATECVKNCEDLGMKLSAVVVIRSSAGCVCEPTDSPPHASSARRDGATAAAVGAVLAGEDAGAQYKQSW